MTCWAKPCFIFLSLYNIRLVRFALETKRSALNEYIWNFAQNFIYWTLAYWITSECSSQLICNTLAPFQIYIISEWVYVRSIPAWRVCFLYVYNILCMTCFDANVISNESSKWPSEHNLSNSVISKPVKYFNPCNEAMTKYIKETPFIYMPSFAPFPNLPLKNDKFLFLQSSSSLKPVLFLFISINFLSTWNRCHSRAFDWL